MRRTREVNIKPCGWPTFMEFIVRLNAWLPGATEEELDRAEKYFHNQSFTDGVEGVKLEKRLRAEKNTKDQVFFENSTWKIIPRLT